MLVCMSYFETVVTSPSGRPERLSSDRVTKSLSVHLNQVSINQGIETVGRKKRMGLVARE